VINLYIGHWPPSEMQGMSLHELYDWYDRAIEIMQAQQEAMKEK
jgi:hypothetical protein